MSKRMVVMLVLCTVVFGGLFGMQWFGKKMMNQYFDNMPLPPATVSSAKVEKAQWRDELGGVGTVVASQGAMLSSESAGLVQTIHVASGAKVKRGDLLITLSSANEQAELASRQAQAALANSELARMKRLFELEAVSKSEFDRAQTEQRAAQAAVEAQRALLAQKQIRAPFAGTLGIRQVNVGQYVQSGTVLFSLSQLDPVYVDFTLPESAIQRVAVGQTVTVRVDGAEQAVEGVISAIEPQIDPQTRNFSVRANVANPNAALRPGQFVRAHVLVGDVREVLWLPRTAINYNPYGNSVFIIGPADKAESGAEPSLVVRQRFVKTGEARGDVVEILDGLKLGEEVATTGLLKLNNGTTVIINNTVQPNAELSPTPNEG